MKEINSNKRKILLFGANGGIGKSILSLLAGSSEVSVIPVNREDIDLLNPASFSSKLAEIVGENKIDAVIYTSGLILDTDTECHPNTQNLEQIFKVNTFAPILIHNFLQDKLSDNAKFVYLSSTATLGPNGLFPLYTTSKKAAETFLKIQSDKIARGENSFKKIICILPGPTNTPMREKIANDASTKQSPVFIANIIKEIVIDNKFENGNFIIAKDNTLSLSL